MKRGFTLIELLIVIAILAVVTAITVPVFVRVKKSAKITVSVSNLRQMHMATMIYQSDYDGGGVYGDIGPMGLPPIDYVFSSLLDLPLSLYESPCGDHPSDSKKVIDYYYHPSFGGALFAEEAVLFEENLVLWKDLNCTDHEVSLWNIFESRRGLAVLLSGQVINHHKPGDMSDPSWWAPPVN